MLMLNANKTADLIDLYKSALICKHLGLEFGIGQDVHGETVSVPAEGVIGGLEIAYEIMGLALPIITEQDVAEFREINGV